MSGAKQTETQGTIFIVSAVIKGMTSDRTNVDKGDVKLGNVFIFQDV